MQALAGIFAVTFPFFALVLCGYVAARSRLLPLDAVAGLNMFVLYFALPCMLWRFGSSTPAAQLFSPVVAGVWLAVGLLLVAEREGLYPTDAELTGALGCWDEKRDGERTFPANDTRKVHQRLARARAAAFVVEHSTLTPPPPCAGGRGGISLLHFS